VNASAAQYKLGVSYLKQSRGPDRDQTMLHKALTELEKVREKYSDQKEYVKQAEEQIRETKRELALHEFLVATFYRKANHYASSNHRLDYLMREYPASPLIGDALFYQGLNYLDLQQPENAKTSFLQLIQRYPENRYAADAQKHLAKLGVTDIVQPLRPTPSATDAARVLSQPKSSEPTRPQRSPIAGYVVTIRDNTVFTNLIRDDGIQEGMVLEIQRDNKLIGAIRITEIHDGFSAAKIESTVAGMTIQEEDQVCCPKPEK